LNIVFSLTTNHQLSQIALLNSLCHYLQAHTKNCGVVFLRLRILTPTSIIAYTTTPGLSYRLFPVPYARIIHSNLSSSWSGTS
jgi:hypothetical protein